MQISDVKDRMRDEQVKLADLESSAKEIKYANEQIQEQIERLKVSYEKFENRRQKEIESLQEKIAFYKTINIDEEKEKYDFSSELKEHKITINEAIAELKSSQKDVKATIAAESRELEILIEKYEKEQKKNKSLKGNVCPTCNQEWEDQNAIDQSDERIKRYEQEMHKYEKSIKQYEKTASQIKKSLDEKRELLIEIKEAMDDIELSVEKKELDNIDIEKFKEKIGTIDNETSEQYLDSKKLRDEKQNIENIIPNTNVILIGSKKFINEKVFELKERQVENLEIIACYNYNEVKNDMKEIVSKYDGMLNTLGINKI